jgi:hypothetical protein
MKSSVIKHEIVDSESYSLFEGLFYKSKKLISVDLYDELDCSINDPLTKELFSDLLYLVREGMLDEYGTQ